MLTAGCVFKIPDLNDIIPWIGASISKSNKGRYITKPAGQTTRAGAGFVNKINKRWIKRICLYNLTSVIIQLLSEGSELVTTLLPNCTNPLEGILFGRPWYRRHGSGRMYPVPKFGSQSRLPGKGSRGAAAFTSLGQDWDCSSLKGPSHRL